MNGVTIGFSHKMVYPNDKVYCIWITMFQGNLHKSKLGACYTIRKFDEYNVYLKEENVEQGFLLRKERFKANFVSLQEFRKRKLKKLNQL